MTEGVWAIVPARGGSKGIPRKNLQKVGGLSLIARSVRAARSAQSVSRVLVSTDDAEIAEEARRHGAEIVVRPAELASDSASSEAALLHTLDAMEAAGAGLPQSLAFVQCTSPFVEGADIDGAVAAMTRAGADCAITVCAFHGFVWKAAGAGALLGVNHDGKRRQRRQDREAEWLENGAVYALRTAAFRHARDRFCGPVAFHEMPAARSLEIDAPDDLRAAQRLAPLFRARVDLENVAAIVFDFDGVMTNNRVVVGQDGHEAVVCDRSDGLGLELAKRSGLPMAILSKERNPVVTARARKVGLECIQGTDDKAPALMAWARQAGVDLARTVYVGNDLNDIPCLEAVGIPVGVADCHPDILPFLRIQLENRGGEGAVREICDLVLAARSAR